MAVYGLDLLRNIRQVGDDSMVRCHRSIDSRTGAVTMKPCHANKRSCPLGGEDIHRDFADLESANMWNNCEAACESGIPMRSLMDRAEHGEHIEESDYENLMEQAKRFENNGLTPYRPYGATIENTISYLKFLKDNGTRDMLKTAERRLSMSKNEDHDDSASKNMDSNVLRKNHSGKANSATMTAKQKQDTTNIIPREKQIAYSKLESFPLKSSLMYAIPGDKVYLDAPTGGDVVATVCPSTDGQVWIEYEALEPDFTGYGDTINVYRKEPILGVRGKMIPLREEPHLDEVKIVSFKPVAHDSDAELEHRRQAHDARLKARARQYGVDKAIAERDHLEADRREEWESKGWLYKKMNPYQPQWTKAMKSNDAIVSEAYEDWKSRHQGYDATILAEKPEI